MQHSIKSKIQEIKQDIHEVWDNSIIPTLCDYIKIPNKSPLFDPEWETHGYMDQAMQLLAGWCQQQPVQGMKLEVAKLPQRTPTLVIEIPGAIEKTVLLYGHMDKQPEMVGWDKDKGPWQPVLQNGKLYGRGGADDGYAVFAAVTAIATLQKHQIPHARCIILIEGCEESGSDDLPYYLEHLRDRIQTPSLVICLDSGAANYQQLWSTTSLRGLAGGRLSVEVLTEGIHSGLGSGVVPSCTMILRQLLDRVENAKTGEIILDELQVAIPEQRIQQAKQTAKKLGEEFFQSLPLMEKTETVSKDIAELLLNRAWRAKLSVTGLDGLPALKDAGNVTIPKLSVKLSMRLPPTCDAAQATHALKNALEKNPPFNAKIKFEAESAATGWHAPALSDWLARANDEASELFFGVPAGYMGEGGSIPFMGMLGEKYPEAQFLITGVLGPKSNAHGPNEFLHIEMAKSLTGCVAAVLESHYCHYKK